MAFGLSALRPRGRTTSTALRIVGVVGWLVYVFAVLGWDDAGPAILFAVLGTMLAGALIGRWWALLVPAGLGVFWLIASVTFAADDGGDAQPIFYGVVSLVFSLGFALVWGWASASPSWWGAGLGRRARVSGALVLHVLLPTARARCRLRRNWAPPHTAHRGTRSAAGVVLFHTRVRMRRCPTRSSNTRGW